MGPPLNDRAPFPPGQLLKLSVPTTVGDDLLSVEQQQLCNRGLDGQTVVALGNNGADWPKEVLEGQSTEFLSIMVCAKLFSPSVVLD